MIKAWTLKAFWYTVLNQKVIKLQRVRDRVQNNSSHVLGCRKINYIGSKRRYRKEVDAQ